MLNFKSLLFCVPAAILLAACGDDVTEVTEIYQKDSTVLEKGEALDSYACTEENVSETVFVKDSASVFICDGENWRSMMGEKGDDGADGKDGENGKDGADGKDGAKGAKGDKGDKGAKGDAGDDGEDGDDGKDGASCTAEANDDNTGFVLTCGGKVVGTIKNGVNGKDGEDGDDGKDGSDCKIVSDQNGVVTLACGEGRSAVSTTLYKAICGTVAFDPAKQYCSQGVVQTYGYINDSRDGQTYKTVKIGKQTWMAENLNYDPNYLPKGAKDSVILSWCYDNKAENCEKYGRLYTWAAAMDSVAAFSDDGKGCGYDAECEPEGNVRGICPEGWHLPSDDEWQILWTAVGGSETAGTKLKSTSGWNDNDGKNSNGMDAFGFAGLPAGYRNRGNFNNVGNFGDFWSSSVYGNGVAYYEAYYASLSYADGAYINYYSMSDGRSVRCIKN